MLWAWDCATAIYITWESRIIIAQNKVKPERKQHNIYIIENLIFINSWIKSWISNVLRDTFSSSIIQTSEYKFNIQNPTRVNYNLRPEAWKAITAIQQPTWRFLLSRRADVYHRRQVSLGALQQNVAILALPAVLYVQEHKVQYFQINNETNLSCYLIVSQENLFF